jgi:protein ImuA
MRYEEGVRARQDIENQDSHPDSGPAGRLAALRARVRRLEGGAAGGGRPLPLGWPAVDAALEGGLAPASVHEAFGPAAPGFALRLLGRLAGPVLWIHPRRQEAALYGPGLARVLPGLADRLIIARAATQAEGLWAAEEGLRSGALATVVLTPAQPVGLTESRRLQLAAERGRTPALLIGGETEEVPTAGLPPSAAATRWSVVPAPSQVPDVAGLAIPRWHLHLLRRRGGGAADWVVESGGL